jgi:hypothetical protein
MKRLTVALLTFLFFAAPLTAEGQQAEKVRRIGYLTMSRLSEPGACLTSRPLRSGCASMAGSWGRPSPSSTAQRKASPTACLLRLDQ